MGGFYRFYGLWAVITLQTLWWNIGAERGSWNKAVFCTKNATTRYDTLLYVIHYQIYTQSKTVRFFGPPCTYTYSGNGEIDWSKIRVSVLRFRILIVSVVKICKQCLQTASALWGRSSPDRLTAPFFATYYRRPFDWFAPPRKKMKNPPLKPCICQTSLSSTTFIDDVAHRFCGRWASTS